MSVRKVITAVSLLLLSSYGHGESNKFTTEFLPPSGIWAANFNFNYGYLDSRYDKDGNKTPIGAETNGFLLDGMPPY